MSKQSGVLSTVYTEALCLGHALLCFNWERSVLAACVEPDLHIPCLVAFALCCFVRRLVPMEHVWIERVHTVLHLLSGGAE